MTGKAVADAMPAGTTSGTPQVLLAHHLKQLKLPTVLREYDKVARESARDGVDHPRYLLRLVELELIDRERRMVERRIRAARFPVVKNFDTFDFIAMPGLNKMLVLELARCDYILRRENVIEQTKNLEVDLPLLLPGLGIKTSPTNRHPLRTLRMQQFDGSAWKLLPTA